jgi:hypothetical protein
MKVWNKEIAKLNNTSEKVYRLLEAHFTPLRQECIVQDPDPAEYKGLQMHIQYYFTPIHQ